MTPFIEQKFNIPELKGISAKNIEEHLKLYAGYVKNANTVLAKMPEYRKYAESDTFAPYVVGELGRRLSFEYNGMRNHEIYFSSLEGGAEALSDNSELKKKIEENWGSFENWLEEFKTQATGTRGIGWQALWYDKTSDNLLNSWIDEQHFGILNGAKMILGLDMWEHAYVADYNPSGKKQYVEDFFLNLNWGEIEKNYTNASK